MHILLYGVGVECNIAVCSIVAVMLRYWQVVNTAARYMLSCLDMGDCMQDTRWSTAAQALEDWLQSQFSSVNPGSTVREEPLSSSE